MVVIYFLLLTCITGTLYSCNCCSDSRYALSAFVHSDDIRSNSDSNSLKIQSKLKQSREYRQKKKIIKALLAIDINGTSLDLELNTTMQMKILLTLGRISVYIARRLMMTRCRRGLIGEEMRLKVVGEYQRRQLAFAVNVFACH